jgi:hypothetical protein
MEKKAMHVRNQAGHGSFMPIHSAIAFLVFGAITLERYMPDPRDFRR